MIYRDPEKHDPIYRLSELLLDLDHNLSLWRDIHVRTVSRVIGRRRGTGGTAGVGYLEGTRVKTAFPLLWEVRTHLKL